MLRYVVWGIIGLSLCISCSSDKMNEDGNTEEQQEENQEIAPEDKLPHISINTSGIEIVDEPKIDASLLIEVAGETVYEGFSGIEIRGATSQMFPKKSYGLETRDENNEDLKVSLLEFPEEEDWILYAPYSDKSLMRNVLVYDLSRAMGQYASRTRFAEVTINNEYKGVYVFMEKLKRDSGRIDINKLKEDENEGEDVTGGYILKIDKMAGSNVGEGYNTLNSFASPYAPPSASSNQEIHFLYEYPDAEDITEQQKEYISTYVNDFEEVLQSDQFKDAENGYAAYIDVDSFIDFFILNELSHNVDGYRLSTYMHKEKNEKLKMGPVWDFNLAFGNADYCGGSSTNTWAYKFNDRCSGDAWLVPFWWDRLLQDEAYVARLQERWASLRGSILSNTSIVAKIDEYNTLLDTSGALTTNFETWDVLGTYVWPNNYVGNTYEEELGYLENWIAARLTWMDAAIENL